MTMVSPDPIRTIQAACLSRAEMPLEGGRAVLLALDGRDARVAVGTAEAEARVAFGCLIRPEPGDAVLTGWDGASLWVLQVLERTSGAPSRLWAEGDIGIVSARGDVSLSAGRAVEIDAAVRGRLSAPDLLVHAGAARFVIADLTQIGRRFELCVEKIRSVGEVVETFARHVMTRAKRASRFIEGSDQMRAGDIDHRAEGHLQLRAKTAFITADTVVRVDADQIHMG